MFFAWTSLFYFWLELPHLEEGTPRLEGLMLATLIGVDGWRGISTRFKADWIDAYNIRTGEDRDAYGEAG